MKAGRVGGEYREPPYADMVAVDWVARMIRGEGAQRLSQTSVDEVALSNPKRHQAAAAHPKSHRVTRLTAVYIYTSMQPVQPHYGPASDSSTTFFSMQ